MLINNYVVDRVRRAIMLSSATERKILWSISQITNPTLSVTSESAEAVDALGSPIVQFNRAKNATFSGENSIFDLGLLAAQSGTSVNISSSTNTFVVPYFDEIKVATADTITLTHDPVSGSIKTLYIQNGDGSISTEFTVGESASGNVVTISDKVVTFASGKAPVGTRIFVSYDITADGTTEVSRVVNTAKNFPKQGLMIVECLGVDPCNKNVLVPLYIKFPNAKLSSDFEINFAVDGTHPFEVQCMQDYCSEDSELFSVCIVPDSTTV